MIRRPSVVALLAAAVCAYSAAPALAVGDLNMLAGNSETSATVDLLIIGPENDFADVTDGGAFQLHQPLPNPEAPGAGYGYAQLKGILPDDCANRDRHLSATIAVKGLAAATEVRTPSCRKRFALDVPSTAAIGSSVQATVTDLFQGAVPLTPTLCVTPPGQPEVCGTAALGANTVSISSSGEWKVRVTTPYQSLSKSVYVGLAAPAPLAPDPNVVLYGDSIMSQLVVPIEDGLPITAHVEKNIEGGGGLVAANHPEHPDWVSFAGGRTDALRPKASVVLLGGGDDGVVINGQLVGQPGWISGYADRVAAMLSALTKDGGRAVWVLNPAPAPASNKGPVLAAIETAVRSAVARVPGSSVVDLGDTLSPSGAFTPSVNGTTVRTEDGLHLSIAGADIGSQQVLAAIGSLDQPLGNFAIAPKLPSLGSTSSTVKPKLTSGSPGTAKVDRHGVFTIKRPQVSCGGDGGNCTVTTSLTTSVRVGKRHKTVKIGSSRATVRKGATGKIKVKLTGSGLKRLKKAHKLKGKLKITVTRSKTKTTKTVSLTLKP